MIIKREVLRLHNRNVNHIIFICAYVLKNGLFKEPFKKYNSRGPLILVDNPQIDSQDTSSTAVVLPIQFKLYPVYGYHT